MHVHICVCVQVGVYGDIQRRYSTQPGWGESRKPPDEGCSLAGASVGQERGIVMLESSSTFNLILLQACSGGWSPSEVKADRKHRMPV